jgi:hypothetical protein
MLDYRYEPRPTAFSLFVIIILTPRVTVQRVLLRGVPVFTQSFQMSQFGYEVSSQKTYVLKDTSWWRYFQK